MESEEQVLVIPAREAEVFTKNAGLSFFSPGGIDRIYSADTFIPRSVAEHDPSHLQIIPYVVFFIRPFDGSEEKVFSYCRGSKGGESRLHAKRSIGIGGHVNSADDAMKMGSKNFDTFSIGMRREIREEVEFDLAWNSNTIGTIYDPSNEVGRVHLGVLEVVELRTDSIRPRDPSIVDAGLQPVSKVISESHLYETWSQMVIEGFLKDIGEFIP
jgi:predicted NUDIX family phosphoesterase